MDFCKLVEMKRQSMLVPDLRKMLGLGKTESYWLMHRGKFEHTQISGKYYININSFEKWYANQTKYKKVNGPPPGSELTALSYAVSDLPAMLNVSNDTIYSRVKTEELEIFMADGQMRITKENFNRWYCNQERFRTEADRQKDMTAIQSSISIPEAAHLLKIHRNSIYALIKNHPERFDIMVVAGKKRITFESFNRWLEGQPRYRKVITPLFSPVSVVSNETKQTDECDRGAITTVQPNKTEAPVKSYYTVEEIQEFFSFTKHDAYSLVQSQEFKVIRAGKRYLIPKESFKAWLQAKQMQKEKA